MGVPCAIGTARRGHRRADAGPRGDRDRQPIRALRTQTGAQAPRLAQDRRAVVRWPGPILVATFALALIGLLALPGYKTELQRPPVPARRHAGQRRIRRADRHFSAARMNPELLMVEADHDLRNSADFLVIDKIAKGIFQVPGIARVQTITRPTGQTHRAHLHPVPAQHAGHHQQMNQKYQQDQWPTC